MPKGFLLKRFSRYLLVFCSGLAIASILPVVASPVREVAERTESNQETLLAQNNSAASLNILAGCLDRSGFRFVRDIQPQASQTFSLLSESPIISGRDGIIDNMRERCANLRSEGQIEQEITCLGNGKRVQVQFKNGQPITTFWEGAKHVFVISYGDGSKGWVFDDFVDYDRSSR